MSGSKWITFLTDYGLANKFVGVCHGVMAGIAPEARVLDVTHFVPRGNIAHGAEVFQQAIAFLPTGVHLTVVDPGVGGSRKAVALVVGENVFVGPDNGLLLPAADVLGGVDAAYELSDPRFHLDNVSHSFHGRDIFSPVAAHLASGVAPAELGPPVDVSELVRLPEQVRRLADDTLYGQVVIEDRFGNLQTTLDIGLLKEAGVALGTEFVLTAGDTTAVVPYVETFCSVGEGESLAHIDSADRLALAVNLGSAAELFSMHEGDTFTLTYGSAG
ncbi:SAM hydrolase/SAM-dependent halogenase family protein [Actinomadura terrae]|uniref:SAM hydrolase/SAM-dependent halogenase family protein n=1 Tax=Actinomadura terrae TaxID=604353 RepID=UPI001FA75875|nr:SAM-dependent chlorinase/fluorinase [Actinomadura terrae]